MTSDRFFVAVQLQMLTSRDALFIPDKRKMHNVVLSELHIIVCHNVDGSELHLEDCASKLTLPREDLLVTFSWSGYSLCSTYSTTIITTAGYPCCQFCNYNNVPHISDDGGYCSWLVQQRTKA